MSRKLKLDVYAINDMIANSFKLNTVHFSTREVRIY